MPLADTAPDDAPPAPIDLRAIADVARRRWRSILAAPLLLLAATSLGLQLVPPRYKSVVQVLLFDPQRPTPASIGLDQGPGRQVDTVAINTEIEVVESTPLALRVATELRLDQNPEFVPHHGIGAVLARLGVASSTNRPNPAIPPDPGAIAEAASLLRDHITAERVPLSYVLAITATSRTPRTAQALAARLADVYLADQEQASRTAFATLAAWLKAKLTELGARIADTGAAIEKLKADRGIVDAGKGSLVEQQIAQLDAELLLVQAGAAEQRARLDQARQHGVAAASLPDTPAMSQLRLQQSLLIRRVQQLRQTLGDRHAQVAGAEAQLAGLGTAIADEAAHEIADLQSSYDLATRRAQTIGADLQQLRAAQTQSGAGVQLLDLQRIADADAKLYQTYAARLNDMQTGASLGNSQDRIISPAGLPVHPAFPPRHLILAAAAAAGLGIGVLLALLADRLHGGIKIGPEAEQTFGYPIVGNIPLQAAEKSRKPAPPLTNAVMLRAFLDAPLSPLSEAVRIIRISLRLPSLGHGPKVIVVTSSLPGEGKSTVAMLLAASSAAARQRTVLVDCDMRGRSVSHDFGPNRPGLTDLLSGAADLPAIIVRDAQTGCYIIPAGSDLPNPGDLLASRSMVECVARLKQDFDYVVLDTSPLLSAVDALVIATMADKILMVIDASNVLHVSVAAALRLLKSESHRIAGIVLNKVAPYQLQRIGLYQTSVARPDAARLAGPAAERG